MDELVHEFRTVALQRLARVETAWATVLTEVDDEAAASIHREIHTLKGESQLLGFSDVNMVCHKLEDLLEVARARGYAVDEDFDLAVNMALRFMAMLVRKRIGSQLRGIDLAGFIKQIDQLLADLGPGRPARATTGTQPPLKRDAATPRVSQAMRVKLGPIAVDAFVEYAAARGVRRDRLRASWHALRELVGIHRAVLGGGQIARHKVGAMQIARDQGKQLAVAFEIESAEVPSEVLAALDASVLHLVRNAVDHGIEPPDMRAAEGKPVVGLVRVRCGLRDDRLTLEIDDDGRGVSYDEVLARALDVGLVAPGTTDVRERWLELVCQPGFSTRREASDVSGRGVGLDAVRAAITDVGGTLTARTARGVGTTWTIAVPVPRLSIAGHVVRAPGLPFPVVLDESWRVVEADPGAPIIDLAVHLGLADGPSGGEPRCFSNGTQTVAVRCERPPTAAQARRLIAVPHPAALEVVLLDTVEGVQLHPERILLR